MTLEEAKAIMASYGIKYDEVRERPDAFMFTDNSAKYDGSYFVMKKDGEILEIQEYVLKESTYTLEDLD